MHVHHNGFHGAGGNSQFLLDKVASRRNPLPHQNFIARATKAGNINILGAEFLRQRDHLWIAAGGHNHLRQGRLMAMHNNVDLIGLEYAQVHGRAFDCGGSEHHVREFRANHRSAPAIGERGAQPLQYQIHRIVIDTDVGAMHGFNNLPVDSAGHDFQSGPQLLTLQRSAPGEGERSFLLAELSQQFLAQFLRDLRLDAALGRDAKFGGQRRQLDLILNLVVGGLAFGRHQECLRNVAAVIGVGGRAGGDHPIQKAGHDHVAGGAADTQLGSGIVERADAARSHIAVTTAQAGFAKAALRLHRIESVPDCLNTCLLR